MCRVTLLVCEVTNLCPVSLDLQGRRGECWEDRPDHRHRGHGWFVDLWRLVGQN